MRCTHGSQAHPALAARVLSRCCLRGSGRYLHWLTGLFFLAVCDWKVLLSNLPCECRYRGEFEERIKAVLKEVADNKGQVGRLVHLVGTRDGLCAACLLCAEHGRQAAGWLWDAGAWA